MKNNKIYHHRLYFWFTGIIFLIVTGMFCPVESYGQSKSQVKTQKSKLTKSKKRNKSGKLQKSYRGSVSRQAEGMGKIYIDPRPRNYSNVQEKRVRNPSSKRHKSYKARKSYYRASSNQRHKSYGAEPIKRTNLQLGYKYTSKGTMASSSVRKQVSAKNKYRKDAKRGMKSAGNMIMQPASRKRDYNEIKNRVQKNPGSTMASRVHKQRNRVREGAQMTQSYRGDITIKAKKQNKLNYKYNAIAVHNSSGNLNARKVASSKKERQMKSASMAAYQGTQKAPHMKAKKKGERYIANSQNLFSGNLNAKKVASSQKERQMKSTSMAAYQGRIKAPREKAQMKGERYISNSQMLFSGELKGRTKKQSDKWYEHDSKTTLNYSGHIKFQPRKKRQQELEGKSMNLADYQGNIKVTVKDQKKKQFELLSKRNQLYAGSINAKRLTSRVENRKKWSAMLASYQGDVKVTTKDKKRLTGEYMSKIAHNYEGSLKRRNPTSQAKYFRDLSDRNQQIIGNYRVRTPLARDIKESVTSARVHNWEGGAKTSFINRLWLKITDRKGDRLKKADNNERKPKYDTRESKIWW